MNIPEHIKELIVENFFDSRLTLGSILKMVNKEYDMTIDELYEFLHEYKEETGISKLRMPSNISEKLKNDIYEKRLLGMPYYKIADELREESVIKISPAKVKEICEKIFAEKKMKEPKTVYRTGIYVIVRDNTIESFKKSGMEPKEIEDYFKKLGVELNNPHRYNKNDKYGVYEMCNDFIYDYIYIAKRERRSYRRIVKELAEKGIETSYETIRKHSKRIYEERKEIEPKVLPKKIERPKKQIPSIPGVYELRKQHLTYKEIQEIINEQSGRNLSYETIRQVCKNDFEARNEVEPKILRSYNLDGDIVNEQIYDLRKHGVSYKEITDILKSQGIKIEKWTVAYRCQRIFESKDEANKSGTKRGRKVSIDPIDEAVYKLRMAGYTDGKIMEFFEKKGVPLTRSFIKNRIFKVFNYKNEPIPKGVFRKTKSDSKRKNISLNVDSAELRNLVYKVAKEKNASKEQLNRFMKEVSQTYNIDLEFDKEDKER